jgi:hypothetical protein
VRREVRVLNGGKAMADKPVTVNPATALKVGEWYGGSYVDQGLEIIVLRTAEKDYSFRWTAADFKKFAAWASQRASQVK